MKRLVKITVGGVTRVIDLARRATTPPPSGGAGYGQSGYGTSGYGS